MYATVPQQRVVHRRVNHGRRINNGRSLALPSQRVPLEGHGLGDFLDVLKNFGSGTVKMLTAGMYDPNKNRFYVPFTGGQVRNAMQGFTNFSTLGLVNTDKFFNSQTMRTIGNVGAGIEAAAVAALGVGAMTGTMGFGASTAQSAGAAATSAAPGSAVPASTSLLSSPTMQSANIARMTGSAVPGAVAPSTIGMFGTAPITGAYASVPTAVNSFGVAASAPSLLSQIGSGITSAFKTLGNVLTTGSQLMSTAKPIIGAVTGGGGGVAPQDAGSGQMIIGGPPIIIAGPGTQVGVPMSGGGYGFLPASYGDFAGGGMVPGGGGGGGGAIMSTGPEAAEGMANLAQEDSMMPILLVGGVLVAAYLYWR